MLRGPKKLVIPSEVEGSRGETVKLTPRDSTIAPDFRRLRKLLRTHIILHPLRQRVVFGDRQIFDVVKHGCSLRGSRRRDFKDDPMHCLTAGSAWALAASVISRSVAMESAGIALLQGDLRGIEKAIRLSRAMMRNIRQSLFFAFVYNSLGLPIAAGILYPWFGLLLRPIIAGVVIVLAPSP